jgi:hypothetical protein
VLQSRSSFAPADVVQSDLLKLTRINFSEAYQILAHLKTVRLFVESALRYGLPAEYAGVIVKVGLPVPPRTLLTDLASDQDGCCHVEDSIRSLLVPICRVSGPFIKEEQEVRRRYCRR